MLYSLDLRKKVLSAYHSGMSRKNVSEVFDVCYKTVCSWIILEKETGSLEPKKGYQKGHSHGIKDLDAFKKYVDEHPDYTQEEIAKHFSVGSSTVGRNLKKIGYTRKKRAKLMPSVVNKSEKHIKKK